MPHDSSTPPSALRISSPCPMKWSELVGDERRRFCGQCSLHVHNAAELTASEARELATSSTGRVCMRIEYDADGRPRHREVEPAARETRARPAAWRALAGWAASAAASVLAACTGGVAAPPPAPGGTPPSRMGKVCASVVMGEASAVETPAAVPLPIERLGDVAAPVEPPPHKPK